VSDKTLAQIGYGAAAQMSSCEQPWADANQAKWKAAADAVVADLARATCHLCAAGKKIAFEEYLGKWDHGGLGGCRASEIWMRSKGRPI
jgi:hypothetical protein